MKNIFKIHPFFYLFAIICIFTGYFKNFCFITFIIVFHELGHILASVFFNWNIDKIVIMPFGGIVLFNEKINRPIKEELIIALMGPIFQSVLFFIDNPLFFKYNLFLIIFNLLPIFPLDGSKILNLFLNYFTYFKISHLISIIISIYLICLILFKIPFNLIFYIVIFFLLLKTIKEIKNHKYIFNKFLLERYLYSFSFKKLKKIDNINKMKRDYEHIIFYKNKYVREYVCLKDLFDI